MTLLDRSERDVFRRVSVFSGGCTAQAAAAVVDEALPDVAEVLGSLVEHSLIRAASSAGRTRFSMLEPVRQYAEARLPGEGALEQTRGRHATWVVGWMRAADTGLRGEDEAQWVAAIEAELANLRAAHRWCCDHDADSALRLVASLFWYGFHYAASELFAWADTTVERFAESGRCSSSWAAGPVTTRPCSSSAARPARSTSTCHSGLAGAYATAALGACRRGDLVRARGLAAHGVSLGRRQPGWCLLRLGRTSQHRARVDGLRTGPGLQ